MHTHTDPVYTSAL